MFGQSSAILVNLGAIALHARHCARTCTNRQGAVGNGSEGGGVARTHDA